MYIWSKSNQFPFNNMKYMIILISSLSLPHKTMLITKYDYKIFKHQYTKVGFIEIFNLSTIISNSTLKKMTKWWLKTTKLLKHVQYYNSWQIKSTHGTYIHVYQKIIYTRVDTWNIRKIQSTMRYFFSERTTRKNIEELINKHKYVM